MIWKTKSSKSPFSSSLKFIFQLTSNRHDLVLLGKYAQLTKIHFQCILTFDLRRKNSEFDNFLGASNDAPLYLLRHYLATKDILPQWGELEGERFCIAPHLTSPFGEEHWKTKSIKRPFSSVLKFVFQLTSNHRNIAGLLRFARNDEKYFRLKRTLKPKF